MRNTGYSNWEFITAERRFLPQFFEWATGRRIVILLQRIYSLEE
jgi:hypothetical protein